jgi:hypothetical protein
MNNLRRQVLFGILLLAISAAFYLLQVRIFHAERDTIFYLFQDLAFLPIQVLLVTVFVDQVLRIHEKTAMLNKLNMVIGAFFSEVGTVLLKSFSQFDLNFEQIRGKMIVTAAWDNKAFREVSREAASLPYHLDLTRKDLAELRTTMIGKRDFLLRLLENQNLLEHDTFTNLLWAVFHLSEELQAREDLAQLTTPDRDHMAADMKRAYALLTIEWLAYMNHLKKDYPYLFSLAVRTNPFDPTASPAVK